MKSKRLCVLSATAVALLSLSGAARADDACETLKRSYTSSSHGKIPGLLDAKGRSEIFMACRSQLNGQPAQSSTQGVATGGTFTTFDIPGSNSGGPTPVAINAAGAITGTYSDPDNRSHSFLRTPDGIVTTFDPPGSTYTQAAGINPAGLITGDYLDATGNHGFLRAPDGTFATIDVPGSNGNFLLNGINPAGTVIGSYVAGSTVHGFLRRADGVITTFDPPGSVFTWAENINPRGAITGFYEVVSPIPEPFGNTVNLGFLRSPAGNIVTFDSPGDSNVDPPITINAEGAITGTYCGDSIEYCHGFLRARDGTFTTIDAGTNFTFNVGIDSAGAIAGWYILADFSGQHAFLRTRQGAFITFDPPGTFTTPTAMNERGTITGFYCDANFLACHGFVWTLHP